MRYLLLAIGYWLFIGRVESAFDCRLGFSVIGCGNDLGNQFVADRIFAIGKLGFIVSFYPAGFIA